MHDIVFNHFGLPIVDESYFQAYAWESREFLRKKIIGKDVVCIMDHVPAQAGGRQFGTLWLVEGETLVQFLIFDAHRVPFRWSADRECRRHDGIGGFSGSEEGWSLAGVSLQRYRFSSTPPFWLVVHGFYEV